VSKIQTMAMQKKLADEATAQPYLDFLDAVYEGPDAATAKMNDIVEAPKRAAEDRTLTEQTKANLGMEQAKKKYIAALVKYGVPEEDAKLMAEKRFKAF